MEVSNVQEKSFMEYNQLFLHYKLNLMLAVMRKRSEYENLGRLHQGVGPEVFVSEYDYIYGIDDVIEFLKAYPIDPYSFIEKYFTSFVYDKAEGLDSSYSSATTKVILPPHSQHLVPAPPPGPRRPPRRLRHAGAVPLPAHGPAVPAGGHRQGQPQEGGGAFAERQGAAVDG